MHARFLSAMCLLLAAIALHAGQPPAPEEARRELIAAYQEYSQFLEKRLKAQIAAPPAIVSETQIDLERLHLAESRHDLALFEGNADEVIRQSRVIVETMQKILDRIMKAYDAGAASRGNLEEFLRLTACARYALALEERKAEFAAEQLRLITDLTERRWNDMKKLHDGGAATRRELDRWERRLTMAAYFSMPGEQSRKEAAQQLRKSIELEAREVERVQQARRLAAASETDELEARLQLANTRLRLAVREEDPNAAMTQLDLQVALCEKLVAMARSSLEAERRLPAWKALLAMARDRRAQSKSGLSRIILDSPYLELIR